jgi:hypothetical protein
MTTWATFRDSLLRPILKDDGCLTDAEIIPKWKDAELMSYGNLAIDDVSAFCPEISYAEATGVDGTRTEFQLPDDLLQLDAVLVGGMPVEECEPMPGKALPGVSSARMYILDWPREGYVTFTKAPTSGSTVAWYYSGYREHITADGDLLPIGRFRWLEQAITMYIGFLAHTREGVGAASLEQWKGRQDLNVGNPLNLEAREFLLQYQRIVRENRARELRTYAGA